MKCPISAIAFDMTSDNIPQKLIIKVILCTVYQFMLIGI